MALILCHSPLVNVQSYAYTQQYDTTLVTPELVRSIYLVIMLSVWLHFFNMSALKWQLQ